MSDAPKDDGCIGFMERKIGSRGLDTVTCYHHYFLYWLMVMEVLSRMLKRTEGGYIYGFRVGNDTREGFYIPHLLFVVDAIYSVMQILNKFFLLE